MRLVGVLVLQLEFSPRQKENSCILCPLQESLINLSGLEISISMLSLLMVTPNCVAVFLSLGGQRVEAS